MIRRFCSFFTNIKLVHKLSLLYAGVIILLISVLSVYTFTELENAAKTGAQELLEHSCDSFVSDVNLNVEHLDKMASLVYDNFSLKEFIYEHDDINTEDLIYFYNNYINNLEKSKNSNPAIYSIRIYLENKNFLERWPIVYNISRLDIVSHKIPRVEAGHLWAVEPELIIPVKTQDGASHKTLVSYKHDLKYGSEHIGFLETSMEFGLFFRGVYEAGESQNLMAIYDVGSDKFYCDGSNKLMINADTDEIFSAFLRKSLQGDGYFEVSIGKELLYVYSRYINPPNIYVFSAISEEMALTGLKKQRNYFIVIAVSCFALLYILTYKIISILLKKLNKIIISMREVTNRNLNVDLDIHGHDEAGELAEHLRLMMARIQALMTDLIRKQKMAKDAEIKALLTQINSHFMNNTLESIRMMAEYNGQLEISNSLSSLGKLLRYSMNWKTAIVPLGTEIENVQSYIELLNIRRDYHINIIMDIEPGLMEYKILKMSLQPVIENAVKHGIDPTQADSVIRVTARRTNNDILIEVSDTGVGIDKENLKWLNEEINTSCEAEGQAFPERPFNDGIGLKNIVSRIQAHYGAEYGIIVFSKLGCFTKVRIKLPGEEISEKEFSVYEEHSDS